eukprot:TRINITY_DN25970_c0_g1_i1.p2 TRINITY_DN25970_c0_g1~~TRINITY_DN25970_c0_g1_i1.p2  ORF type:complete len:216 (+),score=21.86 TRINITY_DN25970_c0_g1_i1:98-745(+)
MSFPPERRSVRSDTCDPATRSSVVRRVAPSTDRALVEQRLRRFYEFYRPDLLPAVRTTLREYRGMEAALFASLVRTYGPEPSAGEVLLRRFPADPAAYETSPSPEAAPPPEAPAGAPPRPPVPVLSPPRRPAARAMAAQAATSAPPLAMQSAPQPPPQLPGLAQQPLPTGQTYPPMGWAFLDTGPAGELQQSQRLAQLAKLEAALAALEANRGIL